MVFSPCRNKEGPFPAIILVSGSGSSSGEPRDGVDSGAHILHAHEFVKDGFAVLRYDPPGIGKSSGVYENASLGKRVEEVHAAVSYLLSRLDIQPKRIGLWGGSQGCWVIAMTAANYPAEIAFIISVSGRQFHPRINKYTVWCPKARHWGCLKKISQKQQYMPGC